MFKLHSEFKPTGDQPQAIEYLVKGINEGKKFQTLLGVTGSGKTFTMANIIEKVQKPTLVLAHNKTLAGQLYSEFKEFFPENNVEYFVSYYDYYQPEAYVPSSDTYIEKDASINDEIDELRHAATSALLTDRNTIVVSSVSCIYGIGDPEDYKNSMLVLRCGQRIKRNDLLEKLVYKENFYNAFKDSELDLPKTYIYDIKSKISFNTLEKEINKFMYPIILKVSNVIEYHQHEFEGQAKIYKLKNFDEVKKVITDIKNSGYSDKLIIQEFIPGDDSMLFDSVFYCSSKGDVQLQSFGQIGLQEHTKTGIGNLTVVINGYNEFNNTKEIQNKLKNFLEKINFKGACEFDLKYDVRDNKFKVFEINPRQARSSYYLTKAGYNLATYFVDDLVYNKKKKFVFIENKVLLSFVPKFVIKHFINNKKYKKQALKLWKKDTYTNPLVYKKDMPIKRRIWLFIRSLNYIKKYKNNNW